MTQRTGTPLALLAAAALALSGCSDAGGGGGGTDAAPTGSPPASAPATSSPAPTPDTSTGTPVPDGDESAAAESALAFVQAVSDGDEEAAFDLLTPSSQDVVGGRAGFSDSRSALAEGFGAFGAVDPRAVVTPVGEGTGVVTLAAEVTREGMTEFGTATLPFREQVGRVALDLFDRAEGTVEFETPTRGGTVPADGVIVLDVPSATGSVVSVDGQRIFTADVVGDVLVRAGLPEGLDSGSPHVLTVAWTDVDGRLGADAIPFTVG